ncbi:uncharacterized protein LOC110192875 [Phascolarctos cinereus]
MNSALEPLLLAILAAGRGDGDLGVPGPRGKGRGIRRVSPTRRELPGTGVGGTQQIFTQKIKKEKRRFPRMRASWGGPRESSLLLPPPPQSRGVPASPSSGSREGRGSRLGSFPRVPPDPR